MFGDPYAFGHFDLPEYGSCGHILHLFVEVETIRKDQSGRLLFTLGSYFLHVFAVWTVPVGRIIKLLRLFGSNLKIFLDY